MAPHPGNGGRRAEAMGRIGIWARPGSREDRIAWDPWRDRWVVHCRAPAQDGKANEAILRMIADRLDIPAGSVRLVSGSRSSSKRIEVEGLADSEVARRLGRAAAPPGP